MGEETPKARKPRADQARNRERLLAAAGEVFRSDGASLEAVARKAGVGIGTLYRHFPTREALFQAVYAREVEALEALAGTGDLTVWMRAALEMVATKKGMVTALAPALDKDAPFFTEQSARLVAAVAALRDRAVAAGQVRAEVEADDLMRVLLGLSYGPGADASRAGLLLDVFLDGLRPR
ncbi:TetR/AcrR family transcriptional regulator [Falsirhodobacter sp. 20TX0035]|uniref:TetR/AcrR family transcriptional regulator n=1 Tax=Falsirhodobacter sp. 20TX0035 TaxID=3022019 RepID=UPI00232F1653|nr:TetR/AcrR family transcriptional regulator [Falsirhodobacter sp. 20TX0035]MDB6454528.1 helix-turn-helix domain containing protein [Falsirhodobacter sp. 20TX0035]